MKVAFLSFALWLTGYSAINAQSIPPDKTDIWEGYLLHDEQGHLQLRSGYTYPCQSWAWPQRFIELKDQKAWAPLVSQCNHGLICICLSNTNAVAVGSIHGRVLVRVYGQVTEDPVKASPPDSNLSKDAAELKLAQEMDNRPLRMHNARLLTVEILPTDWLRWLQQSKWHDYHGMVMGVTNDVVLAQAAKECAPKMLAAFQGMQPIPGATQGQRDLIKQIDPRTCVVDWERQATERYLYNELQRINASQHLALPLENRPLSPPSWKDIKSIFLHAKSRADFLKQLRSKWSGDIRALRLDYTVREEFGWLGEVARVFDVETLWTDEEFIRHQQVTRDHQ